MPIMFPLTMVASSAAAAVPQWCREIRYDASGRRSERMVADTSGNAAATSARSSGAGSVSASSSVSVGSGGTQQARSASRSGSASQSISVERDGDRCTIIIDERAHSKD